MEEKKSVAEGTDNPAYVISPGDFNASEKGIKLKEDIEQVQEKERDQWSNPIEFLLSCVAMSVGLGNVWRFPFTAYENGGGAFLIPYFIVLIFIGRPLYYLELVLGQFTSRGCVDLWDVMPFFKGVGYGQVLVSWCVVTYYAAIMGTTVYYTYASFSGVLPWSVCPENVSNCIDSFTNLSLVPDINDTISSSELYFRNEVAQIDPNGLDNGLTPPSLKMTLSLAVSWIVLFLVLVKGVKSSGKAAYFTALFPYVVLFVLLGRGVTLPGAEIGIKYFITPDWNKLLDLRVWFAAVGQSFFSLSVCFGAIPMLGSFNDFRHNVYRDSTIVSLVDTGTSLLAGFTIFSVLGHLAHLMGTDDIKQVIKGGGSTLAFISYPDVLSRFDYFPQVFAVLFFIMLFTLGVGSASALTSVPITVICDQFPSVQRWKVTLAVCIAGFLCGILYITPQGPYLTDLVDFFGGSFIVYVLAALQTVAICWFYGYSNITRDIKFMLNRTTGFYWAFCWVFFIPALMTVVFVYLMVFWTPLKSGDYIFGPGANAFGFLIVGSAVAIIPLYWIVSVYKRNEDMSASEAFKSLLHPNDQWGPKNPVYKRLYNDYIKFHQIPADQEFTNATVKPSDPTLSFYKYNNS